MTTKEHALYIGTAEKTYDNTYCIGKHSTMHAGIVAHLSCITHFLLVPFDFMSKSFQNGGHSFRIGQAVFSVFVLWRDFPSRFANNGYCTSERQLPGYYGLTPLPPSKTGRESILLSSNLISIESSRKIHSIQHNSNINSNSCKFPNSAHLGQQPCQSHSLSSSRHNGFVLDTHQLDGLSIEKV